MVCLAVGFVLWEVGRNCKDCGAGFGGEEGDGVVWLVLLWFAEGLDGCVCVLCFASMVPPELRFVSLL